MSVREAVERMPDHIRKAPTILAAGDIARLLASHEALLRAGEPIVRLWEAGTGRMMAADARALAQAVKEATQ